MKNSFPLLTSLLLIFTLQLSVAQESLKMDFFTLDSTTVVNGQVEVDVRVRDFEGLIASQYTIVWDSTVLEIVDIPFISADLPGLNIASFALPNQTLSGRKGRLAHTWLSADALPKTLPDNHTLFTMRFKAVGEPCSTTDFQLLRTLNYQTEITNNDLVNVGAEINELPILVTGNNCDGFIEAVACKAFTTKSISPWQSETELIPTDILEAGPYDLSVISVVPNTIDCSNIGDTLLVTATHLPTANTCFGEVLVTDDYGPVLILKENYKVRLTNANAPKPFSARVIASDLDNGSFDNCSDFSSWDFQPAFYDFDCTQLGEQTVEFTALDVFGNATTVQTTVYVELSQNVNIVCPPNIVVDCGTDINDENVIEDILGRASSSSFCVPLYEDMEGFDQNQDGDLNDEYSFNGIMISEEYVRACEYGTIRRVWSMPGSNSTCVQNIGLNNVGSSFNGDEMIDWPYSLNTIVNVEDNDTGRCSPSCPSVNPDSIRIIYDSTGKPIGADMVIECEAALCEEPYWESSSCSLIGWASETEITDMTDGSRSIRKIYYVIDACQFDTLTMEGRWSWTVNAVIPAGINDNVVLSMPDVSVGRGETVCMPVMVENFIEIQSIQGSVNWNAQVAQFHSLTDFGLPGLNEGSFGLNAAASGKLSFAWFDNTTISPASLDDGEALFSVCLTATGDENSSSLVTISNDPTAVEIGSENAVLPYTIEQGSLFVGQANCDPDTLKPVPYCLSSLEATIDNDETEISAIDFNAGSFDNCTSASQLRYSFSDTPPDADPEFSGRSSTRLFTGSDVPANGMIALEVYVWDESGNHDFCSVTLALNEDPTADDVVEFIFGDYYGAKNSEICVPLAVNNFTDVEAFQGTVSWDPSILKYTEARNYALSGFTDANINAGSSSNGILPFVWFDLTAMNPATLQNGSAVFELCFELKGEEGTVSPVNLVSSPALIQVSSASVGVRPFSVNQGSVSILDGDCVFTEANITWPASELFVFVPGINDQNAMGKFQPESLLDLEGIDSSQVYPSVDVIALCQNVYGVSFTDQLFIEGNSMYRIARQWTIIDWLSGTVFNFDQILRNVLPGSFICDTLPNSAPIGDCDSGHSLEDDVEWPDDLAIADHRISPEELNSILGIELGNSRPVFFNTPEAYTASYVDELTELTQDMLTLARVWTVGRQDFPGLSWNYTQEIDIDLRGFGQLVTVNTFGFRPLPGVMINAAAITNNEGVAYTDGVILPSRMDDALNGLTIRDLILMRAHILGRNMLSEFQLRAADLSGEGIVSTLDQVQLERLILREDTVSSRQWRFVEAAGGAVTELEPRAHYIAYKPGDIDDSAVIGSALDSFPTATLMIQDILLNAGERYSIPMYVSGNIEAVATEIHLSFDEAMVDIKNVSTSQNFDRVSFNIINGNRLSMVSSNNNLEARLLDSLSAMVTIEIEALENGTLKNVFGLSSERSSYLLDANYELVLIDDFFEGEISTSLKEPEKAQLFTLYPNPAGQFVNIQKPSAFNSGDYTVELYNSSGQRLLAVQNAGRIEFGDLASGSYVYRIITTQDVQSGMLLINK